MQNTNKHIDHIEDTLFTENGYERTYEALKQFVKSSLKKDGNMTLKIDGSISIIVGFDSDEFFISTKSFFNKTPKLAKSHQDIEEHFNPEIHDKLKAIFDSYKNMDKTDIVYQGDLLFIKELSDSYKETPDLVSFKANVVEYSFGQNSIYYNDVVDSNIGICWHTSYCNNETNSVKDVFPKGHETFDVSCYSMFKDTWVLDEEETMHQIDNVFESHVFLNYYRDDFEHSPIKDLMQLFINSTIRKGISLNQIDIIEELDKFVFSFYCEKMRKYKTEKKRQETQNKMDEARNYIHKHHAYITDFFCLYNYIVFIKNSIIRLLNRSLDFKASPSQEGYVLSYKGSLYKFVNRLEFSHLNFNAWNNVETKIQNKG